MITEAPFCKIKINMPRFNPTVIENSFFSLFIICLVCHFQNRYTTFFSAVLVLLRLHHKKDQNQSGTRESSVGSGPGRWTEDAMAAVAGCFSVLTVAVIAVALAAFAVRVSGNSEGDALYALRRSLSDPDNVLQSWDPNLVNPCTWFHITCNQDNHVTRVDLGNSNLSGFLVPDIGKLEHLQYLELYKNKIQGTIPIELGNLKSLISLDLYNNNISGAIPPSLGKLKNLVFLRLSDNQLTGRIPRELIGTSTLKVVDVSNNNLCGTIPTTGPFEHIPLNNFENNPQLEGPELMGLANYDTNCS